MNPDDPKLTAYALDELDPAERAEIEQLLRENPDALAEVEDTERLAAQLRRELHAEPAAPLTETQRVEVLSVVSEKSIVSLTDDGSKIVRVAWWRRWQVAGLAACVAVLAGLAGLLLVTKYLGVSARVAGNGISDPRPLTAFDERLLEVGDRLVGKKKENGLAAADSPQPTAVPTFTATVSDPAGTVVTGVTAPLSELLAEEVKLAPQTAMPTEAVAVNGVATLDSKNPTPLSSDTLYSLAQPPAGTASNLVVGQIRETPEQLGKTMDKSGPASDDETRGGSRQGINLAWNAPVPNSAPAPDAPSAGTGDRRILAEAKPRPRSMAPAPGAAPAKPSSQPMPVTALSGGVAGRLGGRGVVVSNAAPAAGFEPSLAGLEKRQRPDAERGVERDEYLGRMLAQREPSNTESYDAITDNAFMAVRDNPLSTFSIDVDTASYANVRRFLNEQQLPPKGAVRIEELLNYFDYDYPQPEGDAPFSASMEVAACPWTPEHRLVRIGLKGRDIHPDKRPASNLVFLVDVSGSMQPENKLPLVKKCLRQLVDRLGAEDTVAMAVYAGASGCVLEPTNKKSEMRAALDRLESGGSTNGAAGIQLAYQLAERSFIKGGVNRVILATDGDFNVGVTNQSDLVDLIEKKAKSGVFLTVLGFGMGNLKDSTLEKLADKGNGNYAYIDTFNEGRKVLVEQMSGTLVTIAKDVKIQVEFNPAQVGSYRLIGYENRMLKKEDFNDDTKDAGEIGAGHTVTALYEVVPAGMKVPAGVDALKYQQPLADEESKIQDPKSKITSELLTLKLRYKAPDGDTSKLLEFPLADDGKTYERSSKDFRFAAAVASFGMLLRDSPHKGKANWISTLELAVEGKGEDRNGYRAEFVGLIERAKAASR